MGGQSYAACMSLDHDQPWCYTQNDGWGNCVCEKANPQPAPTITLAPSNGSVGTCGGTGQGTLCQFPFKYKDQSYATCISRDHDQPWCYTQNGGWGNCVCEKADPQPAPTS